MVSPDKESTVYTALNDIPIRSLKRVLDWLREESKDAERALLYSVKPDGSPQTTVYFSGMMAMVAGLRDKIEDIWQTKTSKTEQ